MLAGIDIGYTAAKIAQLGPDGKPIPIKDLSFPEYTYTPSLIFLDQNGAMAGRQAAILLENDPTLFLIKGFMQQLGAGTTIMKISDTEQWSAEAVCALMLKKLRYDIEGKTGQLLKGIVISIPPSFTEKQKKAISYAAAMADIQLKALLPSPLAIAINTPIDKTAPSKIIVIDIGGQFLTLSLLQTGTPQVQLLAHKTLSDFNEDFFNQAIITALKQQFSEKNESFKVSPFIQVQVQKVAELLKKELVTSQQDYLIKSVAIGDYIEEVILDKSAYYESIRGGCQQMMQAGLQLIEENQLEVSDIHSCILTGGASQIPLLQELLLATIPIAPTQLFHQQPIHTATFGAALFGDSLDQTSNIEELPLDFYGKSSINIGIRVTAEDTNQVHIDTLIHENLTLPCRVVKNYYAIPAVDTINFELGYYVGKDNATFKLLDTLIVPIKEESALEKYQLELDCHYTAEGILKVQLTDLQTTFFIKKDYPLFDEQTLLMLQQKRLVKNTMVNNLG